MLVFLFPKPSEASCVLISPRSQLLASFTLTLERACLGQPLPRRIVLTRCFVIPKPSCGPALGLEPPRSWRPHACHFCSSHPACLPRLLLARGRLQNSESLAPPNLPVNRVPPHASASYSCHEANLQLTWVSCGFSIRSPDYSPDRAISSPPSSLRLRRLLHPWSNPFTNINNLEFMAPRWTTSRLPLLMSVDRPQDLSVVVFTCRCPSPIPVSASTFRIVTYFPSFEDSVYGRAVALKFEHAPEPP